MNKINEFLTIEQYSERVFKSVSTIKTWIHKHKPMPGVVNIWKREEGYAFQYDGTFTKHIIRGFTLVEKKEEKDPKQVARERADYIIQKRKLEKRIGQPERWNIVPDYLYTLRVNPLFNGDVFKYLKKGIKLPGVEKVFRKGGEHYLQIENGFDYKKEVQ